MNMARRSSMQRRLERLEQRQVNPKYVDVVVSRWQALSGERAHLDGDGRTFDEIAEERHQATEENVT